MTRPISPGATDQSTVLRALDSTTFLPYTSIAYNTAGIDLWYRREGATKTSITEVTLATLDAAHSDGGVLHIGDGYFRLDLPDAAVAAGVDGVAVGGTATGVIIVGVYHALNFITPASVQSECQDALVAYKLDKLISASIADTDVADNSGLAKLVSKSATADFTTYDWTTDALEANRDNIGTTGAAMTIAAVTGAVGSVTGTVGSVTGLTASNLDATVSSRATPAQILTTALTESYAADGVAPTLTQLLFLVQQSIGDFSISGTTLTVKKIDGTTEAATYTLDDQDNPTSRTRAS